GLHYWHTREESPCPPSSAIPVSISRKFPVACAPSQVLPRLVPPLPAPRRGGPSTRRSDYSVLPITKGVSVVSRLTPKWVMPCVSSFRTAARRLMRCASS